MKVEAVLGVAAVCLGLSACGRTQIAAAGAEAAAKSDTAGAREEALGRVTLTPEAARRLGIATSPVETRDARLTRTYSGELSVPPDQLITVAATVNGFFQLDAETVPGANVRVGQRLF